MTSTIRRATQRRDLAACVAWLAVLSLPLATAAAEPAPEYNRDVRPILARHCFACHGRDEEAREADLRLDNREAAISAGAILVDSPEKSEMLARVESSDPELRMPPPATGDKLTQAEKDTLRRWIKAGAAYQRHWAFVAPQQPPLPTAGRTDWVLQPFDHFVLRRLEKNGMEPSPDAEPAQWLRRVTLDITGLPPTITEADAFLEDPSEEAMAGVVDRLLNSQAYGEHWARMWLDLARYADTKGYEKDRHRDIWRYRDWVIDALNQDMPYDQFTREQLAGDLLPERTTDQILATAFHRNTMTNEEGGTDNEEFRVAAVKDRVDTTFQVWMGLTMGCAKCHSHKYDPISLSDYYSVYACFNQTQDADNEGPFWPTPTAEQSARVDQLQREVKQLESELPEKPSKPEADRLAKLRKLLQQARSSVTKTPVMLELDEKRRRTTRIHVRGNFLDPGDEVTPDVLTIFGPLPADAKADRLGVANWLMRDDNPLTARVMVNRVWARIFGVGLVETEEDFGTQGLPPSHPDVLDWLSVDFRKNGWSVKKLIRGIVVSRTYRQSSRATADQWQRDPRNRLLGRGPRFRLPAETVRDQALAVSGLLTHKIGGPSVMPPQPAGVWKSTYNGGDWKDAEGPDRFRRGLYTYRKRTSPYPAMLTFDAGSGEVCQVRRVRTNTPLQALVTLNDKAFVEAAGGLADLMKNDGESIEAQIHGGFRRVLIRPPTKIELNRLVKLYDSLEDSLANGDQFLEAARRKSGDPRMVVLASVLLNLDETLMKP